MPAAETAPLIIRVEKGQTSRVAPRPLKGAYMNITGTTRIENKPDYKYQVSDYGVNYVQFSANYNVGAKFTVYMGARWSYSSFLAPSLFTWSFAYSVMTWHPTLCRSNSMMLNLQKPHFWFTCGDSACKKASVTWMTSTLKTTINNISTTVIGMLSSHMTFLHVAGLVKKDPNAGGATVPDPNAKHTPYCYFNVTWEVVPTGSIPAAAPSEAAAKKPAAAAPDVSQDLVELLTHTALRLAGFASCSWSI